MSNSFIDNRSRILKDELVETMTSGSRVQVAAQVFSMYAFRELADKLKGLEEFRFIYTDPAFATEEVAKERREFYIPRLTREQGVFGTEFEIKLRNELTQKAVAQECAAWIRKCAHFKSPKTGSAPVVPALTIERIGTPSSVAGASATASAPSTTTPTSSMGVSSASAEKNYITYLPLQEGFTAGTLGVGDRPVTSGISRQECAASKQFYDLFTQAWESQELEDVTRAVIASIEQMYRENPPELIYYSALYHIFHEFLDDISADALPKEGAGLKQSKIWNLLYDFQQDAALAIITKLQTYNGCILADSVGLGKTFTALAVIKYYESLNRNVLVLCPKRLQDNWTTYNNNLTNNPIAEDRLRYDVLFHTDLSRERGKSATGIDLATINWGNYDLVVIDESHNFRNGADSAVAEKNGKPAGENRYQRLLNKVLKSGVPTKVLMLSATPVNNRFRDLRNQLALAYQGESKQWSDKLGLSSNVEDVFKQAQSVFNNWSQLPTNARTTKALTDRLDYDFFRVLDQVTVARSRRHVQSYYDVSAIGPFPKRLDPISIFPKLSELEDAPSYQEIASMLEQLNLMVYSPSQYVLPSAQYKYARGGAAQHKNLTSAGREAGVRHFMAANLLKRLESSISSFRLTLERVRATMQETIDTIEKFKRSGAAHLTPNAGQNIDWDADDAEEIELLGSTTVGKDEYDLRDLDWRKWETHIEHDLAILQQLIAMVAPIDAAHDAKLQELKTLLAAKAEHPINPDNKKVIIFTAFADTAMYLYEQFKPFAKNQLGLHMACITGASGSKTTCPGVMGNLGDILACFSPHSKERNHLSPKLADKNIDILIATDCISEGQNLQDADYLINYDIHWNPVRIVQRFGRIDRIGSKNATIQLVNFWPDKDLDRYIKLKDRVKNRMQVVVMSATGDDDYLNEAEKGDLAYRRHQLETMQKQVVDLEDVSGGISITDLGLNDFRMDLIAYYHDNPAIDKLPKGIDAVVEGEAPGIIFVLKNRNQALDAQTKISIHPFYLVYVSAEGEIIHSYLEPKETLDTLRRLCKGQSEPNARLCRSYARATKDGRDMRSASSHLRAAIESIVSVKQEEDVMSFFTNGTTSFLENDIAGLNDFELICFLVVMPHV